MEKIFSSSHTGGNNIEEIRQSNSREKTTYMR